MITAKTHQDKLNDIKLETSNRANSPGFFLVISAVVVISVFVIGLAILFLSEL